MSELRKRSVYPDWGYVNGEYMQGWSNWHAVVTWLQQRIPLGGRRSLDGIFEVFNLFDYANFGSFTNDVDSPLYGRPVYNPDVAYGSRSVQLGFRLAF
jgi:hypothetical protein